MFPATVPAAPPAVESSAFARYVRPGDQAAHLFSTGAGWSRCLCRAMLWTAALRVAGDEPMCPDCEAVRERIEEVPETEKRLLGGDR